MALMPSNLLTGSVLTKVEIIPKDWERLSENKGLSLILTIYLKKRGGGGQEWRYTLVSLELGMETGVSLHVQPGWTAKPQAPVRAGRWHLKN